MAQDNMIGITESLFGVAPTQQSDMNYALQNLKGLSASEIGGAQLYAAGRGLGRGLMQLTGTEDPEMAQANKVKQATAQVQQQGIDTQTSQGMKAVAQILNQQGESALAFKANQVATVLEEKEADIGKKRAETTKLAMASAKEEQLRAALAALPPNATEQDYLQVYRQYGSPDQQAKMIEMSLANKAKLEAKTQSLPASLQKSEDEDLKMIDNLDAQQKALGPSIQNLTPDAQGVRKLELGPTKNLKYMAQNASGNSTPESRAYEALKSAVDTAVNLQVSAEKGVQTDKDVLRFANALVAAYGRNDTAATLAALKRFEEAIVNAKAKTQARLEARRKSQGVKAYYEGGIPTTEPTSTPTAPTKRTMTLKSGKVVTIED